MASCGWNWRRSHATSEGEATIEQAEEAPRRWCSGSTRRASPPATCASACCCNSRPAHAYGDVLRVLISDHLTDIQQNRPPDDREADRVHARDDQGGHRAAQALDPRPGARFNQEDNQYVLPDLIVEPDEHGEYQVRLVDDYAPQLGISTVVPEDAQEQAG